MLGFGDMELSSLSWGRLCMELASHLAFPLAREGGHLPCGSVVQATEQITRADGPAGVWEGHTRTSKPCIASVG